jgi:hypothetical protein
VQFIEISIVDDEDYEPDMDFYMDIVAEDQAAGEIYEPDFGFYLINQFGHSGRGSGGG